MVLNEASAVLFESGEDEESLVVECAVTAEGGLSLMQESDGPLTSWCFEESPHRIEVEVDPADACALAERMGLDEAGQLPAALRCEFTGYDCLREIRVLMKRAGIRYRVIEHPIVR